MSDHLCRGAVAVATAVALFLLVAGGAGAAAERIVLLEGVPRLYRPDAGLVTETFALPESLTVSMEGNVLFEGTADELVENGVTLRASRIGRLSLVLSGGGKESAVAVNTDH